MVDDFIAGRAKGKKFVGCHSLEELVKSLATPRKVMMMVKAGPAVDDLIEHLLPLLEPGDIIIDGGNTLLCRHRAPHASMSKSKACCSSAPAFPAAKKAPQRSQHDARRQRRGLAAVKPIFQAIAAKVGPKNDIPCCEWVGPRGAGHYVKMVHNGIEYGDMQLICEAYFMLKKRSDCRTTSCTTSSPSGTAANWTAT